MKNMRLQKKRRKSEKYARVRKDGKAKKEKVRSTRKTFNITFVNQIYEIVNLKHNQVEPNAFRHRHCRHRQTRDKLGQKREKLTLASR